MKKKRRPQRHNQNEKFTYSCSFFNRVFSFFFIIWLTFKRLLLANTFIFLLLPPRLFVSHCCWIPEFKSILTGPAKPPSLFPATATTERRDQPPRSHCSTLRCRRRNWPKVLSFPFHPPVLHTPLLLTMRSPQSMNCRWKNINSEKVLLLKSNFYGIHLLFS